MRGATNCFELSGSRKFLDGNTERSDRGYSQAMGT